MIEFFIGFLIFQEPEGQIYMSTESFATHSECSTAIQRVEENLKAVAPEGTDIRLSCISSASIGQNAA